MSISPAGQQIENASIHMVDAIFMADTVACY
jgi:hypothetical protein